MASRVCKAPRPFGRNRARPSGFICPCERRNYSTFGELCQVEAVAITVRRPLAPLLWGT